MNQCFSQYPEIAQYSTELFAFLWGSVPVILSIWGSLCAMKIVKAVMNV